MLLKVKRIVDRQAVKDAKKPYSEISGQPTYGAPCHHVITVGSGGPDHRFNLIQTTGSEHIDCHGGKYSKEYLFGVIAEREGETVDFIIAEINRMRRGICAD